MKIGYLGPKSSFTHLAAQEAYPENACIPYGSISLCIQALANGVIDRAVVPNENSLEGSVHATIDTLFRQNQLSIEQEIILPINHQLLVSQQIAKDNRPITKIISHPQALAQCADFVF